MARRPAIRVRLDKVQDVKESIIALAETRLFVGIPQDKTTRQHVDGEPINNASLLYIHEHGAPERNIPAREVMGPVIQENRDDIATAFRKAGVASFHGDLDGFNNTLGRLGQKIADLCRVRILTHIPPPLSKKTVLRRTTRLAKYRNASKSRRAQMRADATTPAAIADAVPLWDTGQMARAITWVIRKVKGARAGR